MDLKIFIASSRHFTSKAPALLQPGSSAVVRGQPVPRAALDLSPEALNKLTAFALWCIKQILLLFQLPFYAEKMRG